MCSLKIEAVMRPKFIISSWLAYNKISYKLRHLSVNHPLRNDRDFFDFGGLSLDRKWIDLA